MLFYVIINFYDNYFITIIVIYLFFHENYFYFFMFRDVPECSMFLVLSTPDNSIAFVFTDKWQMADFMQITGRTLNVQPGNLHKIFSRFKARQAVKFLPVQTKESNESQTFHSPARQ